MTDTIAAIATAEGMGGIAIIRISGPDALPILERVFSRKREYIPNMLYHGFVLDAAGARVDEAMAVYMKGPKSYTAEDVCEIQCHGGNIAAKRTLDTVLRAGARAAEPGEFTRRAFVNGRIDLADAEAVMQLISARSEAAARASVRQLTGGVSARLRPITDALTAVQALIEAGDDYPDEMDEDDIRRDVRGEICAAIDGLDKMCDARAARIVMGGASVVLAGRPNVGKSSIMNALLGTDRAIVTNVPGTTRDVLTEHVSINGVDVELTDTAGRRDADDAIEKIGVARAEKAAETADLVLIVLDGGAGMDESDVQLLKKADKRYAVCINKQDISSKIDAELISKEYNIDTVTVSALTGAGMDDLRALIAGRVTPDEPALVSRRHMEAAGRARDALRRAVESMDGGYPSDVAAIDVMSALDSLYEITGENAREAVIDRVFRDFCVGK